MLVSFMVPLILTEPADSMTYKKVTLLSDENTTEKIPVTNLGINISGDAQNMVSNAAGTSGNIANGVTYTPAQMDVLALLFGGTVDEDGVLKLQDIYEGCKTVDEALEVDKETYFLGFASDFCAFIEGDFTATDADAEGRVAVGGNLRFDWDDRKWNYQIGSGDYEVMSPLDEVKWTDDYRNVYGFASALVGGQMFRINTLSTGNSANNKESGRHLNSKGDTAYYGPDEGLFKYFLVAGGTESFLHYDEDVGADKAYNNACTHDFPGSCSLCSSADPEHGYLESVNELAQMYVYKDVREIIKETFVYVRSRSETLSSMKGIKALVTVNEFQDDGSTPKNYKVIFDAASASKNDKTVYFDLDHWDDNYVKFEFVNIPEDANIVINCGEEGTVNISSDGNGGGKGDLVTSINGVVISKQGLSDEEYKKAGNWNNHPDSARLLYNFYNTTEVNIDGCFNGTVLAPYADAYSNKDKCSGHLSGALIAKSFYGGLEFGYRPYRGSSEIFSTTSGYEVPVHKLFSGSSNDPLSGAMFEIVELDSVVGANILSLFESSKYGNFVSLPTHIDYSGNTYYIAESVQNIAVNKEKVTVELNDQDHQLQGDYNVLAYKDGNYVDVIGTDAIPLQGKFYIKASQNVELTELNGVAASSQTGSDRYEVTLSKPITSTDYTVSLKVSNGNSSQDKVITVKFIPMELKLANNSVEVGNQINFWLDKYPTDGAQFEYYYSINDGEFNNKIDMYGASGNFTPNQSGTYRVKAVASYNGVPIAEAISAEIEVKEKQAQEVHNPYISVNNENPSKGSNIVLEVKDLPDGASTPQWTINDQFVNGGSTCNYTIPSGGTYTIKATYTWNGNTYDIYKSIRAYEPQIWVSKDTVTQGESFDFNVYDLPNGVSVTKWTFIGLTVAENTSSGSYNPEYVGSYELAAELSDGSRISKWINVNQKIDNIDTSNMEITATSAYGSNFYRGVKITFGVNNAPSGANINYKLDYYGNDISGYMQNNTLTPASAGTIVVSATVNGQAVPQTKTISIVDFKLNINPPEHRINSNVTLNVVYADDMSVPSDVISSVQFYIDNSDNEMSDYHLCSGNGSSFTAAQQGTYKIKAVISMTAGGTAEVTNSMITHSSEWNPDNSVSSTAMTFNAESDIAALAIETNYSNDDGKGKITITYPGVGDNNYEQYLSRVRLNIPYVQDDYSIKATINSKDSNEIKEMYLSRDQIQNQNMYWAEFTFAYDEKVTEVVIEAVTGNPKVTGYQISNYVQRFNVEKTYPANGEIATNKSYVLTFDSEVVPLEDFTLYFLKNSVKFNISFIDEAGNKLSYNNGNTAPWTTENGTFVFSEKNIAFDNGKSIADVAKVVVSAVTDDSDESNDEFKVSHYTIKTTKDEEVTTDGIDAAIEEHTYIIRESKAPNGFVKTDANYKVVVKETIHLGEENIINNVYPKKSKAEITIYKSAENASFTTDEDYSVADKYESEPMFTTTLDILNDYDSNIRTIQYSDGTIFEITRGKDDATKDIVQSVKLNGAEVSRDVIADLNKPQEFKIGEKRYYYNPATAMVVELSNENLNYYNVSGLNFQKMDDIGIPVKGAEIVLKKKTDGAFVEVGAPLWEWSNKSVEATIDIYQLDVGTIYGFFEGAPPEGYEKSDPIYFKVIETDGTRTVRYSMSEDDLSNESCDTLDMVDNRTIVMTDDRILGAKLNLKKVDENKNFLDGAKFSLYADDGTETLIKSGISPITGDGIYVDLTQDVEQNIGNYVENGYLKPGRYFLIETTVPNGYKDPGAIRFTVGPDYSIILGGEGGKAYINKITSIGVSGGDPASLVINGNIVMDEPFGDSNAPELGFGDVKHMKVVFKDGATVNQIWIDSGTGNGSDMTNGNSGRIDCYNNHIFEVEFDTPRDIYQFKVYGSNIEFTAVEITDSEGNVLKYPPENTGTEDTDDTNSAIKDFTVQNLLDDGCTNIPIEKIWLNDSSFAAFREPIEIILYRTTTPITDYSNLPTNGEIAKDKDGNNVKVTLNAENNWKYTFTDVKAKDDSDNPYYFYMVEVPCTGYKAPVYGKKVDGTLTVKNELDSVNVPVKKKLDLKNNIGTDKPESIVLRLQINNNGEWVDVEGKTITVSAATDWSGIITDLLRGKQYRLVENAVVGWEIDTTRIDVISITTNSSDPIVDTGDYNNYMDDDPDFLELINVEKIPPRGSIQLDKVWDVTGGTDADIPSSIYFKLYRVAKKFYPKQTAAEVQEDYARLLQYSLYFYDANMCGTDVAGNGSDIPRNSALGWRGNCHEEDAINGVVGGYHDAGDHVMFGLPQGFSATMLGWNYYEFKEQYAALNQTDHYKIISDRFNDFFAQCIKDMDGTTKILVQKGDGDIDHKLWGAPETQQDRTNEMIWSDKGSDIAAEYAASLALSYLNFYRDDLPEAEKTKYKNHLAVAKKLYDFATTANREKYSNSFYPSGSDNDDKALAAGWLYLATVKEGPAVDRYKNECNVTETKPITWDEVHTAAAYVKARIDGSWDGVVNHITGICDNNSDSYYRGPHSWGTARHNALNQTIALAVAKNIKGSQPKKAEKIANWCKKQMAIILGNNNWKDGESVCLVTGFAENSAKYAHHRAASGWASHDEYRVNSTYDSDGRIIIGALAGGPAFDGHWDQQQMIDYGHDNCVAKHIYLDDL
ncbi:MAG: choice-of-anchor A family protein, partial [Ruminococcus sp.]|nr:choice-of-anchor A family protein [Ruminococcus sp.]